MLKKQRFEMDNSKSRNILFDGNIFLDDRIMNYFRVYVIVLKASHHSQITEFELQVLYSLNTKLA